MTFFDRIKETSTSTGTGTFTLSGAAVGYKAFTNGTYKYCIVNSTETEWEVGEGTVASGVLTRTTIEASSNLGSVVNFSAGTKYVFNTVSAAYVNSLVPYTGATASVNLGEFGLTAGQLTLDTTPTGTAVVGTTQWNDTIGSSQTLLKGGSVLLKNGVDLVARVVNKVTPSTTLTKAAYKAVRVSGAQGQRLAVAYAQANTDNNSADTIGLVCETIAANQEGFIITVGQLLEVNTTGSLQGETWADGDVLYLSPTTAGNLTNIKPTGATGHIVVIGYVEYAHSIHGSIYVKIMNGWELDELHNVYISSVANNQVLVYESSSTLWKNKSIATILGYTPQAAITLTTTGSSGAATFVSNTLNIPTVTLAGLGGASDSLVMHLAGTETATGVKTFSIGLATTTGDNFMNTSSGNLLVGYAATPGSNVYKINVNGNALITGILNANNGYLQVFDNDAIYINNNATANGRLKMFGTSTQIWMYNSGTLRTTIASETGRTLISHSSGQIDLGSSIGLSVYQDGKVTIGRPLSISSTAILEVYTTTQGILIPRLTTAQKNAISTPATSLLLYDTDLSTFQYYSGSAWTSLGGGSGTAGQVTYWSGTSAVTGSSNLFWDNTNGRLGIGTSSPLEELHIFGTVYIKAKANNDNIFFKGVNNAGTTISQMLEASSSGLGGLQFDGQRNTGTNGNGVLFQGFTGSLNRSAIEFIGFGGTMSTIADLNANVPIAIFSKWSSSAVSAQLYIHSSGNITTQNGGTFTDAGYRLDVNGTGATAGALRVTGGSSIMQGSGATSSTFSLTIQDSGSINLFRIRNDGKLIIGDAVKQPYISSNDSANPIKNGTNLVFYSTTSNQTSNTGAFWFTGDLFIHTTGSPAGMVLDISYTASTGSAAYRCLQLSPTINQTGTATGISRGLYVNPTLTAAADFRAIETTNGKIVFGNLPTSSAGLPTGALWNNSGVINIV
jgi:hypothetical protein